MTSNLAGRLVKIYQDPLTERDFEGIAKVVKIYDSFPVDGQIMYEARVIFKREGITHFRRFTERQILDSRAH
jgi:hypothetical protein